MPFSGTTTTQQQQQQQQLGHGRGVSVAGKGSAPLLQTTAALWELGNFIGNFELLRRDGVILGGLEQTVVLYMVNDVLHIRAEDEFHRVRSVSLRRDDVEQLIANQDPSLRQYENRVALLEFIVSRLFLGQPDSGDSGDSSRKQSRRSMIRRSSSSSSVGSVGSSNTGISAGSRAGGRSGGGTTQRTQLLVLDDVEFKAHRENLRQIDRDMQRAASCTTTSSSSSRSGGGEGATTGHPNQPISDAFRQQRRALRWQSLKNKLAVPTKRPLEDLEDAVARNPDDVVSKRELGFAYFHASRYADAAGVLTQISDRQEHFVKSANLGNFWLVLAQSHLYAFYEDPTEGRSRMEPALMAYQRATREFKNIINPNSWLEMGVVYMQLGAYELAAQTLMRVVCTFKTFAQMNEVVFLAGVMMHVLNQHKKAAQLLRFTLRSPPPPYELADIHFVLGRVLSFIETRDCQEKSKRHLQKSFALLKLNDRVGNSRGWKKWYRREAWAYFGTRFASNRDYVLAADAFQQLCERDGSDPGDWVLLASAQVNISRGHAAVLTLHRGLKRFPNDEDLLQLLSRAEEADWATSFDGAAGGLVGKTQRESQTQSSLDIQAADETLHGKSGLRERYLKQKRLAAEGSAESSGENVSVPSGSRSTDGMGSDVPNNVSSPTDQCGHDDDIASLDLLTMSPHTLEQVLDNLFRVQQRQALSKSEAESSDLAATSSAQQSTLPRRVSVNSLFNTAPSDPDFRKKKAKGEAAVDQLQRGFHRHRRRRQKVARDMSANTINRVTRGFLTRAQFRKLGAKAAEIQKIQRARTARRRTARLRDEKAARKTEERQIAATVLQRNVRKLKSKKDSLALWRERNPEVHYEEEDADRWFIAELFDESTPAEKQLTNDFNEIRSTGYLDGSRSRMRTYWTKTLEWGVENFSAVGPENAQAEKHGYVSDEVLSDEEAVAKDDGTNGSKQATNEPQRQFLASMARLQMRAPSVPATFAFCALCEMRGVFQDALDKLMGQRYLRELPLVQHVVDVEAYMRACGWRSGNQKVDSDSEDDNRERFNRPMTVPAVLPSGRTRNSDQTSHRGKALRDEYNKARSSTAPGNSDDHMAQPSRSSKRRTARQPQKNRSSRLSGNGARTATLPWKHLKDDTSRRFLPQVGSSAATAKAATQGEKRRKHRNAGNGRGRGRGRGRGFRNQGRQPKCNFSRMVDAAFSNADLPTIIGHERSVAKNEWGVSPVQEGTVARPSNRLRSFTREQLTMSWDALHEGFR